jgi:hypothetical protein
MTTAVHESAQQTAEHKTPSATATATATATTPAQQILLQKEEDRNDTIRYLIATMMLGQMYAQHDDAKLIHAALSEATGEGQQLRISLAFASAMGGDATPANALLAEGVDNWPDAEMAKVALSLALKMAGDPAWQGPSQEAMSVSVNHSVRQFAHAVLQEV